MSDPKALQKLKAAFSKLSDSDFEDADHLCFMHLKDASTEFGRQGAVALKLLDLAEELMK